MSDSGESSAKRFFTHPLTLTAIVAGGILWAVSGFPPLGFPEGEYECVARSGAQDYPISVFRVSGEPMTVIEYRPGESVDVSSGMTYSHSQFERELTLHLAGETYRCVHD